MTRLLLAVAALGLAAGVFAVVLYGSGAGSRGIVITAATFAFIAAGIAFGWLDRGARGK